MGLQAGLFLRPGGGGPAGTYLGGGGIGGTPRGGGGPGDPKKIGAKKLSPGKRWHLQGPVADSPQEYATG